jgi:pheromone shutdown protein TraB
MELAEIPVPKRVVVIVGLLALFALAALFALDYFVFSRPGANSSTGSWLVAVIAAPVYLLLQVFAEGVASAYWEAHCRSVKVLPIAIMLVFYAAWLWLRF